MDYITLYVLGDIHYGARDCMVDNLRPYIAHIAQDEHAAVVLAGDLINNGVKSSKTNVYEETIMPGQQKRDMIELLRPVSDKIICAVAGNHERRTARESDVDLTYDMCCAWGVETSYTPDMAFLKISLGRKANNKPVTYMLLVTHGAGGGVLLGSGINKPDAMQIRVDGLDGIISGHTHKPAKVPSARLIFDPRNNNVIVTTSLIYVCTSWLDYGGYAAEKLMPPVAFHPDTIRIDGRVKAWS